MTISYQPPPKAWKTSPVLHVFPQRERYAGRDDRIRRAYANLPQRGALVMLAQEFGLTTARIHQIVFGRSPR